MVGVREYCLTVPGPRPGARGPLIFATDRDSLEGERVRLLFVKEALAWPRSSGHDVHCFNMMQALTGLGHEVALLTAAEPAAEAIAGLPLILRRTFAELADAAGPVVRLGRFQARFRSYWGI